MDEKYIISQESNTEKQIFGFHRGYHINVQQEDTTFKYSCRNNVTTEKFSQSLLCIRHEEDCKNAAVQGDHFNETEWRYF